MMLQRMIVDDDDIAGLGDDVEDDVGDESVGGLTGDDMVDLLVLEVMLEMLCCRCCWVYW